MTHNTVATTVELPSDFGASFVSIAEGYSDDPSGPYPTKNPLIIDSKVSP
jgi:hypothetical protein